MNNQAKLMDEDKFLKWLDGEDAACLWEGPEGLMKYQMLVETINDGEFEPDPVPTIKPGDTTDIKVFCGECNFECVIQYDAEGFVYPEGHCPNCGGAADLEVVE